jgi:hypothetical protein
MNLLDKAWELASKNQRKLMLIALLLYGAFEFREYAIEEVQGQVYKIIIPMKEKREIQLNHMEEKIDSIADDTREIKRILMER